MASGVIMDPGSPVPAWATGSGEPAEVCRTCGSRTPRLRRVRARARRPLQRATTPRRARPARCRASISGRSGTSPTTVPSSLPRRSTTRPSRSRRRFTGASSTAPGRRYTTRATDTTGSCSASSPPRGRTTGDNPGNFSGMVPAAIRPRAVLRRLEPAPAPGIGGDRARLPVDRIGVQAVPERAPGAVRGHRRRGAPVPAGSARSERRGPERAGLRRPREPATPREDARLDPARVRPEQAVRPVLDRVRLQDEPAHPARPALVRAAAYLNWSEYISWRDPRIRAYNQYLLTDPPRPRRTSTRVSSFWTER